MEPVRPDYSGACLANLVRALLSGGLEAWVPDPVRDASSVVLLVVDGFGAWMLDDNRASMPAIASMERGPLSTVVPSTTAVALTSLTTGLPPAEHGITGYRMKLGASVLNVLRWSVPPGADVPDPEEVQPRDAFQGRQVTVVARKQFDRTPFTRAHLGGARMAGWSATSNLPAICRRLVDEGERFVYAYYDGLDITCHERGLRDDFFVRELKFVDGLVEQLLDSLPESTVLVVTGDHGHVHIEEKIALTGVHGLVQTFSGEGRFRDLHAVPGAAGELADACRELFGARAWVLTRDDLFDDGWMGPRAPSPSVRRRVGDVILAARDPVMFVDPTNKGELKYLSFHGSVTAQEMLVPLAAARGTDRRSSSGASPTPVTTGPSDHV
ncbi:MAG TPA: alkaline phosphatase family protein [Actinomycetota bacterium]|nr:alkaline phosphatase family protein [Actinomycetota bacterium]